MEKEVVDLTIDENSFDDVDVQEATPEAVLSGMSASVECVHPNQKLEFFRSKSTALKCTPDMTTDDGYQHHPDGSTKRTKGHRKGVMLAFEDPTDEKILIGYSLCHKRDTFDHRNGMNIPGLGIWFACNKATKHKDSKRFHVCTLPSDRQRPKSVVKIPQSMAKDLAKFIGRCRKFYKDKELPEWATNFALEQLPQLGETVDEE